MPHSVAVDSTAKSVRRISFVLLACLLSFGSTRPARAQASITIGDTKLESADDSENGNLAMAQAAVLGQSATIVSLSFYVTHASGNLILGLYDATGPNGHPGQLMAVTNSFATASGWNTANVVTPVSLAAGNYWLAYLPSSNGLSFRKQNNTGSCVYKGQTFSNGMPATFATSTSNCAPTTWSFYATVVTSGGGGSLVNGACGSSNGATLASAPTTNLCSAGTASAVTGTGPWNWTCAGSGGTTASCSAQPQGGSAVAPTITTQPHSQAVAVGAMATFTVAASGTAPLSYQWLKNGTAIAGATSSSYTTPATVSGDNGATFTVKVSNSAGSQMSNAATLTVTGTPVAPTITAQPQNETVTVGSTATFSVVASGTAPLSYQWSRNGAAIGSARGPSYTTPATVSGDNGATFTVKVSNSAGSQTSNAATLTVSAASGAATPILFQHIASSTDPVGSGIPGHAFVFHTETLPANTVAVMGVSVPAGVTPTITDSLAGSWSAAVCGASGSGNVNSWVFVQALGASGGADTITINVGSSDTQPVQFDVTFWENIDTTTPVAGHLCSGDIIPTASGLIGPGSFTPTRNDANGGNVIWNYTPLALGYSRTSVTGYVPGPAFELLNGGGVLWPVTGYPQASQYYLQTTAASVTPSITATGENASSGDVFNSTTVALAVANNGATAPSKIHVASIIHETIAEGSSPGAATAPFPTRGNFRILSTTWEGGCPGGGPPCLSSISSSDGCAWTVVGNAGNGDAVLGYAQNCAPCPACTVTLHFTGGGGFQGSFRLFDVENAASSSYQDEASGNGSCGSGTLNDAPTITPSGASSGLAIAASGIGTGPGLSVTSPVGAVFDLWTFAGQTDADTADNADLLGHYYFSSTATQNWDWTLHPSSCYWVGAIFD